MVERKSIQLIKSGIPSQGGVGSSKLELRSSLSSGSTVISAPTVTSAQSLYQIDVNAYKKDKVVASLRKQLSQAVKLAKQHASTARALAMELDQLKKSTKEVEVEHEELLNDMQDVIQENDDLKVKLQETFTKYRELKSNYTDLQREHVSLEIELEKNEVRNESSKSEVVSFQEKSNTLRDNDSDGSSDEELVTELDHVKESLQEVQDENNELVNDMQDVVQENDEMRRKLEQSERKYETLERKYNELQKDQEHLEETLETHRAGHLTPEEVAERIEQARQRVLKKLKISGKEKKELDEKCSKIEKENLELKADLDDLIKKNAEKDVKLAEMSEALSKNPVIRSEMKRRTGEYIRDLKVSKEEKQVVLNKAMKSIDGIQSREGFSSSLSSLNVLLSSSSQWMAQRSNSPTHTEKQREIKRMAAA